MFLTPYIPTLQQTDSTKCSTDYSDYWTLSYAQKRSRQALSLCGGTECTYNTVVVNVGPAGSVGCVPQPPCNRSGANPQLISTTLNFSTDGDSERSLPTCLPPQFQPLFNFMEGIASIYDGNFMRNGAGKLLTYELLSLTGIGLCKISTIRDPRTNWWGYPESTTKPLGKLYGKVILLLDYSKSIDSFFTPPSIPPACIPWSLSFLKFLPSALQARYWAHGRSLQDNSVYLFASTS